MGYNVIEESNKIHTHFKILEREESFTLTDDLQIHYLELPKLPDDKEIEELEGEELWSAFLKEAGKAGNEEKLARLRERSESMKIAMTSLETVSADKKMIELHRAREKARRDEISRIKYAEKQGVIKTAEEMLKDGMELDKVSKYTKLSLDELKEIEKKVKAKQN